MFKIVQVRLQQYVNRELPDVQAGFRKGRGARDQIANICWIIEKAREFQKSIYFCFIDYAKAFDCVDHNKLRKILKEMGIPDHLTSLLRNLYAGQEVTVRTGHGITNWFQIGKGICQGCILSPCLFNLYEEYIMRNAGLEDAQAGIKIARRNINKLRYTDDTTLMAESEIWLASLVAKRLKRLPAIRETWVRSLGQEYPLEKEMATHSSILAWRIPWTEEPGGLQSTGHKESDMSEQLHFTSRS